MAELNRAPMNSRRQSLWMLAAGLLFAMMGVCVKLGAARYSAGELAFYRGLVSMLMVGWFARANGWHLRSPYPKQQMTRGIAGAGALMLYFYAISTLPLPTAVTLNYTAPLWLTLILAAMARRLPRAGLIVALATGFVGVVLLLRPAFSGEQWLGALLGTLSGFVAGIAIYNVRQLGELGEPEWRTVFWFSLICTVAGAPWALLGAIHAIDLEGGMLLLGVGVFGGLAQLAMTRSYARGRTLLSASLAYSTVVFASLFGWLLWNDVLDALSWLAIGLIAASGLIASIRSRTSTAEPD